MNRKESYAEGWVIMGPGDFIIDDSFSRTRKEAIAWLSNAHYTWKQRRKQGFRCVKASKTITVL